MSFQAKRELLGQVAPRYHEARGVNSSEEVSMNYSDGATQHPDRVPAILRVQAPLSPLCGRPETCCLPR